MKQRFRHRRKIQYLLISATLLIQIGILIFFYNEYFNENKLKDIAAKLEVSNSLHKASLSSQYALQEAHVYLQSYVNTPEKRFLDLYFDALKTAINILDSTQAYIALIKVQDNFAQDIEKRYTIDELERLIDSTYRSAPRLNNIVTPIDVQEIVIEDVSPIIELEAHVKADSTPQKKLLERIKDAVVGKVDVKTDTVYVTTKYNNAIDTAKIKTDIDSTLKTVQHHYQSAIQNYQRNIQSLSENSKKIYEIYNNLLQISTDIIQVYQLSSEDLTRNLEAEYAAQSSTNSTIRKYTVFALMILMIIVLFIMAYFTKMSFVYERALKEANQEVEDNLHFKNRIIGMLSHEVRAPLKIINLFIKRIFSKTDDPQIISQLKAMQFTNESLLLQANQILEYSKDHTRIHTLQTTTFNLYEELSVIFQIFEPYILSANNTLHVDLNVPQELQVAADKVRLHQLFINLLGNANKFTEVGKIEVRVSWHSKSEQHGQLRLQISDTGVGIAPEDIHRIFDPYYQGTISPEVQNLGAGLGLNLCKDIVDRFGGDIQVESELGAGTIVRCVLFINIA